MSHSNRASSSLRTRAASLVMIGLLFLMAGMLPGGAATVAFASVESDAVSKVNHQEAPGWLDQVEAPGDLYTEYAFPILAGRLINFGVVDASACPNSGLAENGDATECGVEVARPAMLEWQNRLNPAIVAAGQQFGVPPVMMKNIFAWESQFWPQAVYVNTMEYGLGHITFSGAESLLRWDEEFYQQVCKVSYSSENCQEAYIDQPEAIQNGLQGMVIQLADANCESCRFNLDMQQAEASVSIFARALIVNQRFVEKSVKALSGRDAVDTLSRDDLWKFTLVSYNAGPGCFFNAYSSIYYLGLSQTWSNLKGFLEPACRTAVPYIQSAMDTSAYHPVVEAVVPPAPGDTIELGPAPVFPPGGKSAPHSEDEIVIKVDPTNAGALADTLTKAGVSDADILGAIKPLGAVVIKVTPDTLSSVLAALHNQPGVLSAGFNYLVEAAGVPDDPEFSRQPNLAAVQAPQAWDAITTPGSPVVVAVIDSGMDASHPDLAAQMWQNPGESGVDSAGNEKRSNGADDDANGYVDDWQGWNMVANNNLIGDDQGHGTHVAGIIGAVSNNGVGISGIAPNAVLMPVKVLDQNGQGTHAQVAEGILYAVNQGAQVINLGLGGQGSSEVLQSAVNYALAHGVLMVAAAGNDGAWSAYYPAAYSGVLATGAVNNMGDGSSFSSRGNHLSLVAPGEAIYSTLPGGAYGADTGTSMSSAHVSGAAALLAGQPKFVDVNFLRSALVGGVLDLGAQGRDPVFGYGVLQVLQALLYTGATEPPPPPGSTPPFGPGTVDSLHVNFWASSQDCNGALLATGSGNFDGLYAQCAAAADNTGLTVQAFSSAINFTDVSSAELVIGWYVAPPDPTALPLPVYLDDTYEIQIATDCADAGCTTGTWSTLKTYNPVTPPPAVPAFYETVDVSALVDTPAKANNLRMRIWYTTGADTLADGLAIYLDQAVLTFATPLHIHLPRNGASYSQGSTVGFVGNALSGGGADLSATIVWYLDSVMPINVIGGGETFTRKASTFSTGAHSIIAEVVDGATTYQTSVTINITADPQLHGGFSGYSDACATCHRAHSASGPTYLLTNTTQSTWTSNEFCLNCHGSGTNAVGTHTNAGITAAQEQPFALMCIQCHDPHGSTGNLFNVRAGLMMILEDPDPTVAGPILTAPVTFTNMTTEMDAMCVSCHSNADNPGAPMAAHDGGLNHAGPVDYTGKSCISCHTHENGFMYVP